MRSHQVGERLKLDPVYKDPFSDRVVDRLVGDAVERYLHLHGIGAPIAAKRREAVIRPLMLGTILRTLNLSLVVPITLTHFEVDHFSLPEYPRSFSSEERL